MQADLTDEHWAFVATEAAGRRERRYARVAILVSFLVFIVAIPFAKLPLPQVPAFIPAYVTALVMCDLITAALLFGQFSVLRSAALLILGAGYLFSASITLAYALLFPGLFGLSFLPEPGPQTSSAMYMFWHAGFPLFLMAYALEPGRKVGAGVCRALCLAIGAVWALVLALSLLATWGHPAIPVFIQGNQTTPLGHQTLSAIWLLSLTALCVLWRRRAHTVLDIWLLIVLCVWLFDLALAAILNTGRYDLGWYVGRIYGLLAASALLVFLLLENGRQYGRLVRLSAELSTVNQALAQLTRHDGLTGLANRRYFDEYLAQHIALARRQSRPLALVLCDIDCFKAYNDHYGHQAGDHCLQQVAQALRSVCLRSSDMPARYGGEEFAIILPDCDSEGAFQVAEASRLALLRLAIPHATSPLATLVSISCGTAVLRLDDAMDAHELIASADQALYRAKKLGRNQVVCAPAAPA